jgi:hypothetical protein
LVGSPGTHLNLAWGSWQYKRLPAARSKHGHCCPCKVGFTTLLRKVCSMRP